MIAHVRGRLIEKHPTRVVVEMGGLGLEIQVPLTASEAMGDVGDDVALHTVLVVREDALALYGFRTAQERTLFLKLIAVSGIGPKIALNALSVPSLAQLVAALRGQDLAFLTRLPGIGKKTAERMSLELKDGLAEFAAEPAEGSPGRAEADAVAALVSLGYTRPSALDAVQRAARESAAGTDPETLIRTALQRLAGGRASEADPSARGPLPHPPNRSPTRETSSSPGTRKRDLDGRDPSLWIDVEATGCRGRPPMRARLLDLVALALLMPIGAAALLELVLANLLAPLLDQTSHESFPS